MDPTHSVYKAEFAIALHREAKFGATFPGRKLGPGLCLSVARVGGVGAMRACFVPGLFIQFAHFSSQPGNISRWSRRLRVLAG